MQICYKSLTKPLSDLELPKISQNKSGTVPPEELISLIYFPTI